jgi:hypothetical protein
MQGRDISAIYVYYEEVNQRIIKGSARGFSHCSLSGGYRALYTVFLQEVSGLIPQYPYRRVQGSYHSILTGGFRAHTKVSLQEGSGFITRYSVRRVQGPLHSILKGGFRVHDTLF